jgi:hypothetical protein
MKFTVSGVRGRVIKSARVSLVAQNSSNLGGFFHRVGNLSWAERTVTWANAPAGDAATIASLGPVASGRTYTVDMSTLISGDGVYSFRVSSTASDGAGYYTRESSHKPQLIIEVQ